MAQTIFPLSTPIDITPTSSDVWQTRDLSSYIPEGATGVIIHLSNTLGGSGNWRFGARPTGSADDYRERVRSLSHLWVASGVNASRQIDLRCEYISAGNMRCWLVAYTMSGITFFATKKNKTPGTTDAWVDIDCSADAPNAIALIFEVQNTGGYTTHYGLRKKDSTDEHHLGDELNCHIWFLVGCDASQVCRAYREAASGTFSLLLIGYITDGVTMFTNGVDKSLSVTDSYQTIDCSTEAPNAVLLFFECYATGVTVINYALRKDTGAADIYGFGCHPMAMVRCSPTQTVRGKVGESFADEKFSLLGYAEAPAPPPPKPSGGSMAAKMMSAGLL